MTTEEFKKAEKAKLPVRFGRRRGFIIDSFTDSQGNVIAVVGQATGGVGYGNNVPLSQLEIDQEAR